MLDALTYSSLSLFTTARAYNSSSFSAEKNLVPERQKLYQVRLIRWLLPVFYIHWVCLLQHSHKPIYYRPPRSRLYLGIHGLF